MWLHSRTSARGSVRGLQLLVLAASIITSCRALGLQQCVAQPSLSGPRDSVVNMLPFGEGGTVLNVSKQLGPGYVCQFWRLRNQDIIMEETCASRNGNRSVYLLFEFWRLEEPGPDGTIRVDSRRMANVYFLVARGLQPNVTYTSSEVLYSPPRASQPQLGQSGALQDEAADSAWRPYHRILVPTDANVTLPRPGASPQTLDWFLTVASMDRDSAIESYSIRVRCVSPSDEQQAGAGREAAGPGTNGTAAGSGVGAGGVPCPEPELQSGPCSGRGTCVMPPQGVNRPLLNKVCRCEDNWGDYGCQLPVQTLSNNDTATVQVGQGDWTYFQFSLTLPPGAALAPSGKPALLVEVTRASGNGFGGDPVLLLMQKEPTGSNRVPWFMDVNRNTDLKSYSLQQNFHYIMQRDLSPVPLSDAPVSTGNEPVTVSYYVALYNSDQRFQRDQRLRSTVANLTLTVRWRTGGPSSPPGPLCPGDCFGHGTCFDPLDSPINTITTQPALSAMLPARRQDFACACRPGWGGTMCEARARNMSVSVSGDSTTDTLLPGEWYFMLLNFDSRRFDYRSNDVAIQWNVRDDTGEPASAYSNAFLTIDENAFPRDSQLDADDPFKRGWQIFYNTLASRSNPPQPLQMKGSDLKPGYVYVLGVYNSDYTRTTPFRFSVNVYVPTSSTTWLHPYMSVVLGVTASVILCLFMTVCHRIIQRYGWSPFRRRNAAGASGVGGPGGAVGQLVAAVPPRNQGVPSHIVDTFRTYEYGGSTAEKAQLAKSCRDHDTMCAATTAAVTADGQHYADPQQQQQQQQQVSGEPAVDGAAPGAFAAADAVDSSGSSRSSSTDASGTAKQPSSAAPPPLQPVPSAAAAAAGTAAVVQQGAAAAAALETDRRSLELSGGPSRLGTKVSASAVGGVSRLAAEAEDDPQCTVCLCEYEGGERITQLPCKHEFHSTCINKWMLTHNTCPICRVLLVPNDQQQQPPGAVAVPVGELAATASAPMPAGGGDGNAGSLPPTASGGLMARVMGGLRRPRGSGRQQQQQAVQLQQLPSVQVAGELPTAASAPVGAGGGEEAAHTAVQVYPVDDGQEAGSRAPGLQQEELRRTRSGGHGRSSRRRQAAGRQGGGAGASVTPLAEESAAALAAAGAEAGSAGAGAAVAGLPAVVVAAEEAELGASRRQREASSSGGGTAPAGASRRVSAAGSVGGAAAGATGAAPRRT